MELDKETKEGGIERTLEIHDGGNQTGPQCLFQVSLLSESRRKGGHLEAWWTS